MSSASLKSPRTQRNGIMAHGFRHRLAKYSAAFGQLTRHLKPRGRYGITGRIGKSQPLKNSPLKKEHIKMALATHFEENGDQHSTSEDTSEEELQIGKEQLEQSLLSLDPASESLETSEEEDIQSEEEPEPAQTSLNGLTSPLLLCSAYVENGRLVGTMDSTLFQLLPDQEEKSLAEDSENIQKAYLFKHYRKNISLLLLRHPTTLLISGEIGARVLHGSVSVHGHTLSPQDSDWVTLHCSPNIGYLPIATAGDIAATTDSAPCWERMASFLGTLNAADMLDSVKEHFDADCCTLMAVVKHMNTGILDKSAMKLPFSSVKLLKNMGIDLVKRNAENLRVIKQSNHQEELASSLLADAMKLASSGAVPVVVVCGGRNLGKSTYLRYLVNRFLAEYECVYHLDLDPGQPEFTLAGCLSLSKVTKPLLGPPFTHLQQPERCIYLGQVDISKIGPTYFSSMLQLISHYNTQYHGRAPLVVNTMGWISGMGFQFLVDIVRYSRPTHLIQLNLDQDCSPFNMPQLTPEFLQQASGWGSTPFRQDFKLLVTPGKPANMRFTSRQFREFNICYYLDRLSHSSFFAMDHWTCYDVPWKDLAVCFCHEIVPASQIFQVLNASLVALCSVEEEVLNSATLHDKMLPAVLSECPKNQCLGFGIIVQIDLTNHTLCIATPEPLKVLSKVNVLYRGQVVLPDQIFLRQNHDGVLPYVHKEVQKPKFAALALPIKKQGTTVKTRPDT